MISVPPFGSSASAPSRTRWGTLGPRTHPGRVLPSRVDREQGDDIATTHSAETAGAEQAGTRGVRTRPGVLVAGVIAGAGNRGTDAMTLLIAIPLLTVALIGYRRGSLRTSLLLTGALAWIMYI